MAITSFVDDQKNWYKDAIIYELHIKAFFDSNSDGIGDFEGLLQKLDYLEDLGVTAIWLLPFYPSPLRDDGYDIADYYSINPSYGEIEDFKRLVEEAHKRGLKVITELVINHTSDQHEWFQRARKAPEGSNTETIMSGPITLISIKMPVSFLQIPNLRTGRGMPKQMLITGTAFSHINLI